MPIDPVESPVPSAGRAGLVRLLQLASPSLPVGGFSYSQGLETAVECGWVSDLDGFMDWADSLLRDGLTHLDMPVLARLVQAALDGRGSDFERWIDFFLVSRETRELREEEAARGRAMSQVLSALSIDVPQELKRPVAASQLGGLAWAARHWNLPARSLCEAFAFSWLENLVMAGIKLVPFGQSDGQRALSELGASIPARVDDALELADDELGASSPAQVIASAVHETQYTRLFRS